MVGVIRRKVRQSWRDAVAGRLGSERPGEVSSGVAEFDLAVANGTAEAEAAFALLASRGLLWEVEGAGFTLPVPAGPAEKHAVPSL